MSAIEIRNVAFSYRAGKEILRIPSFHVQRGERVFLSGVLHGHLGELRVLDHDLGKMSNHRRDAFRGAHIGYIFQLFNLISYLNVIDNITLPCRFSSERRRRLGGADLTKAAGKIALQLGVEAFLNEEVTRLSVGQQQRVAAARALLGNPELVIADEPTSALDYDQRERFIQLLFERCHEAGSTLIFVSHDRTLAPLFDRTVSLGAINEAGGESRRLCCPSSTIP